MDTLEYWRDLAWSMIKAKKADVNMPMAVSEIIKMEDFQITNITEQELIDSIKLLFVAERKAIVERMREKMKKDN